jgi:hypothetical protein
MYVQQPQLPEYASDIIDHHAGFTNGPFEFLGRNAEPVGPIVQFLVVVDVDTFPIGGSF